MIKFNGDDEEGDAAGKGSGVHSLRRVARLLPWVRKTLKNLGFKALGLSRVLHRVSISSYGVPLFSSQCPFVNHQHPSNSD